MTVIAGLPKNGFGDLIEVITASTDVTDLQSNVNLICNVNGFPLVTYHMIHAAGLPRPLATHFSSYPMDWVSHYVDTGLFFRDPVVQHASDTVAPFSWHDLQSDNLGESGREFFLEASAAGIADGLSVPIRGPHDFALFSVCAGAHRPGNFDLIAQNKPYMTILGLAVHERARKLYQPKALSGAGVKALSPRQREVMQWIACGKSAWDISRILNISESRVRRAAADAFQKLNCHDRTHAAIRAVLLGMIEPPS